MTAVPPEKPDMRAAEGEGSSDGGPAPSTPGREPFRVSKSVARRVKLADKTADVLIRLGGTLVILAIALIFVFILREVLPLFYAATVGEPQVHRALSASEGGAPLAAGTDEFESFVYMARADSSVELRTLPAWEGIPALRSTYLGSRHVNTAYLGPSRGLLLLGTDDGHVGLVQVTFDEAFTSDGKRTIKPGLKDLALVQLPGSSKAVQRLFGRWNINGGVAFVAETGEGNLVVATVTSSGFEKAEDSAGLLSSPEGADITDGPFQIQTLKTALDAPTVAMAMDSDANLLLVATAAGTLYQWQLTADASKPFAIYTSPGKLASEFGVRPAGPRDDTRRITALEILIGDQSVIVGYDDGALEDWLGVRQSESDVLKKIRPVRIFDSLPARVTALRPSDRNKTFLAASSDGTAELAYSTSGRRLASYRIGGYPVDLGYSPKLTSVLAVTREGDVDYRTLSDPHPDISLGMLFGKVWYEGYDRPEYIWQSSSGSDAFEPKFSLVPLIIGTLKGAFYGLLFAIPIALFAALYTSQFLSASLRAVFKPIIEVMAALPSVVIGFLAGLWLAPILEDKLPALMFLGLLVPVVILAMTAVWRIVPKALKAWLPEGREVFVLIPLVVLCLWASLAIGPSIDRALFGGDIRQWIFNTFQVRVEQRNSIVVGIAMGFAVIPMIFTIADDAFSNVPKSFTSASLALGASRWQTALRVIAPTASPGVFSAVMIGFGRAVGETMIVLMATGNTPVLSFSPFNGMRTLSANIAVEIPEAPLNETHYRVLFLAALLLFILTFVVNTAAEVVRQRLREKYQAV